MITIIVQIAGAFLSLLSGIFFLKDFKTGGEYEVGKFNKVFFSGVLAGLVGLFFKFLTQGA